MTVITTTKELKQVCARMKNSAFIAIDTEFMRERTYWAQLCLIQVASEDEAVAVDPLAPEIDLKPFYRLLSNKKILKVFHAGRQDIEIFYRETGKVPFPVFDTQVAGTVCGLGDQVSYENMVKKLVHAKIDKTSRFTDWSRRPLSNKQIEYALDDVRYLRPAYEKLRERLEKHDRMAWLEEEEKVLFNPDTYAYDPYNAWKRIKISNHKPRTLAILREVAAWREALAQEKNIPRNRVIRDDTVAAVALHPPKKHEDLSKIRNMHQHILGNEEYSANLLEAIQTGLNLPDKKCPHKAKKPHLQPGIGPVVELLRVLLKQKSEENFVAQRLIANAAELELIADSDEADVPAMRSWRYEIFGKDALALKHGKIGLSIDKQHIKIMRLKDK